MSNSLNLHLMAAALLLVTGISHAEQSAAESQPAPDKPSLSEQAQQWGEKTQALGASAWESTKEAASKAGESGKGYLNDAGETLGQHYQSAKQKTGELYDQIKQKSGDWYDSAKQKGQQLLEPDEPETPQPAPVTTI